MVLLSNAIVNNIRCVQEIFANNIEILRVEELSGKEEALRVYNLKTPEYQNYYNVLKIINSREDLTFKQKYEQILIMCSYSLNVNISTDEFLSSFLIFTYTLRKKKTTL